MCVDERKEPDALDIFLKITSIFLATLLMKWGLFSVLHKGGVSLILADAPIYLLSITRYFAKSKKINQKR